MNKVDLRRTDIVGICGHSRRRERRRNQSNKQGWQTAHFAKPPTQNERPNGHNHSCGSSQFLENPVADLPFDEID
jgi:hypothetical protein